MDQFNNLYNILMEQLNADILAPNNGSTGGSLKMTDTFAAGDLRRPVVLGQYSRNGKIKPRKSGKKK